MKRMMTVVFAFALLPAVARAQQETPVAEVAAGYSVIYVVKGFTYFMNGGSTSVAFNVNNWFGLVGDFGAYHAPSGVNSLTAETYTIGPRVSFRGWNRFVPFGQFLVGGLHSSVATTAFTGNTNALAFAAGGGADFLLNRSGRVALRPQLEYFGFRSGGNTVGNVRFSVGVVFRLGKRE